MRSTAPLRERPTPRPEKPRASPRRAWSRAPVAHSSSSRSSAKRKDHDVAGLPCSARRWTLKRGSRRALPRRRRASSTRPRRKRPALGRVLPDADGTCSPLGRQARRARPEVPRDLRRAGHAEKRAAKRGFRDYEPRADASRTRGRLPGSDDGDEGRGTSDGRWRNDSFRHRDARETAAFGQQKRHSRALDASGARRDDKRGFPGCVENRRDESRGHTGWPVRRRRRRNGRPAKRSFATETTPRRSPLAIKKTRRTYGTYRATHCVGEREPGGCARFLLRRGGCRGRHATRRQPHDGARAPSQSRSRCLFSSGSGFGS